MIKLTPEQKGLLAIIKRKPPVLSSYLATVFRCSERRIRYRIQGLRRLGIGIIRTQRGYMVSRKATVLLSQSESLRHQGLSMLRTAKGLKQRAQEIANPRLVRK